MSEVKLIKVEVICDTVVFNGRYYEKGKTIENFPYKEADHKNMLKPVEEVKVVEEPKSEEIQAPKVYEPVRDVKTPKKGNK